MKVTVGKCNFKYYFHRVQLAVFFCPLTAAQPKTKQNTYPLAIKQKKTLYPLIKAIVEKSQNK